MKLLRLVRLSVMISSVLAARRMSIDSMSHLTEEKVRQAEADPRQGGVMCARLSKEPYFGVEMLIDRTWRIYYSWNMDLQNRCLDMVFRNATPAIIRRFYKDMNDYLVAEPYWDAAATILVSMGRAKHEMLLFAEQGVTGRFQGVPNMKRDGSIIPTKKMVPLLVFHLKLLYGGKYLLMSDCQIGVTTLSGLRRTLPYRAEIDGIADNLDFGPGLHACQSDKNKNENAPSK